MMLYIVLGLDALNNSKNHCLLCNAKLPGEPSRTDVKMTEEHFESIKNLIIGENCLPGKRLNVDFTSLF